MAKFAQEKLDAPSWDIKDTTQREVTQVVSSPVNTYVRPAENQMNQLVEALQGFLGAADRVSTNMDKIALEEKKKQNEEDELLGYKANKAGEAVPPEASEAFQRGHLKGHWDTASDTAVAEVTAEYDQLKFDPSYNPKEHLRKRIEQDLQGVTDKNALNIYLNKFGKLEERILGDFTKVQTEELYKKRDEDFNVQQSSLVDRLLQPEGPGKLSTEEFFTEWGIMQEDFKARGKTRAEMTASLLDSIQAKSTEAGGRPELFDVFYEKDPLTGNAIVSLDKSLEEKVVNAKKQALALYDGKISKEVALKNEDTMESFWDAIRVGELDKVSDEALQSHRVANGALDPNKNEFYHQLRAARERRRAELEALAVAEQEVVIDGKELWQYNEKTQKDWLEKTLKPEVDAIVGNINTANGIAPEAIRRIVQAHSTTNSSVFSDSLKNLTDTVLQLAPDAKSTDAKVPARFDNLSAVYRAMKSSPNGNLVNAYFDDKTKNVMEHYNGLIASGIDKDTAFVKAFRSISPEAREQAKQRATSIEGRALIKDAVTGVLTGVGAEGDVSGRANIIRTEGFSAFGFELMRGSIPTNYDMVIAKATTEAERYLLDNFSAGQKDLEGHLKTWARQRYIHDYTTNTIVEVPPMYSSKDVANAFTEHSKEIERRYGSDAAPRYEHLGEGKYAVVLGKTGARLGGNISIQDIQRWHRSRVGLDAAARDTVTSLQEKARAGTLKAEEVEANKDLIAKATAIGLWTDKDKEVSDKLRVGQAPEFGALAQEVKASGARPGPINPKLSRIPDLTAKLPVARMLKEQGDHAGALTVMGEGVALKAYLDAAGKPTIGVGYNMEANSKTIKDDFRRAGITASVEDIKAGKASISTEQAVRLYQVVKPRYEAQARKAYETRYKKRDFDKLSSAEKAVLTDMAYQAGDISGFSSLFDSLVGKKEVTRETLQMTYLSDKDNKRKVDDHRTNLRLNMLTGRFDLSMQHAGVYKK